MGREGQERKERKGGTKRERQGGEKAKWRRERKEEKSQEGGSQEGAKEGRGVPHAPGSFRGLGRGGENAGCEGEGEGELHANQLGKHAGY